MDVRIATDGEEVLAMLLESAPDLILLDIMMPKLNGFQVLEEMSCMPSMKDVAVIVISAVSDNEAIRKGYALGARDYFVKPFRVGELLSRLRTHLQAASYQQMPGQPLDHEVGDDEQLAEEVRVMLDRPKRGPLSVLSATLEGQGGEQVKEKALLELAKELRIQVRGVDRLFLMPDQRLVFSLPNTIERGVAALQERVSEQLLNLLQRENLAGLFNIRWERETVAPGAAPTGLAERLLSSASSEAGDLDLSLVPEPEQKG